MARYNEILVGRYNRYLQKLLSLKGGPPAPQLSTDISVVLPLYHGRETYLHQGWSSYGSWGNATGGVGQTSGHRLRNPANSNVLVVLERILMTDIANDNAVLETSYTPITTDLPTSASNGVARDTRSTSGKGTAILSTGTNVTILGNTLAKWSPNAPYQGMFDLLRGEIDAIIITPGQCAQLTCGVNNQALQAAWWWRERSLEEGELVQ